MKIDHKENIALHNKAACVLNMIAQCDVRFNKRIDAYQAVNGTAKDYTNAALSLVTKDRLIKYYSRLVVRIASKAFEIKMTSLGIKK